MFQRLHSKNLTALSMRFISNMLALLSVPLPSSIAKSGFFPLEKRHFTVITDDRHQLTLRVEQQNNKAITTPVRNSDLGEYFRNRLGLQNGAYITQDDLERYGRTDVKFVKLDEETYYMDFSSCYSY